MPKPFSCWEPQQYSHKGQNTESIYIISNDGGSVILFTLRNSKYSKKNVCFLFSVNIQLVSFAAVFHVGEFWCGAVSLDLVDILTKCQAMKTTKLHISLQTHKGLSLCCCPADLTFGSIKCCGFFRPPLFTLPSVALQSRSESRSLAQHLSAICRVLSVMHHLRKKVSVKWVCWEKKCSNRDFSHLMKGVN